MMGIMSRLTPTCSEVTRKLSRGLDEKLSLRDRVAIKIHLFGCDLCQRYARQIKSVEKMLRQYSDQMTISDEFNLGPIAHKRIEKAMKDSKNN